MINLAINGFGRIGRNAFKVAFEAYRDRLAIVAINDITEPKTLAHLLKYDTSYGIWNRHIRAEDDSLVVDDVTVPVYAIKEPSELPWSNHSVDVVIESTGRFTDEEGMKKHITAGAKCVVLSAPAKGGGVETFLIGLNQDKYKGQQLINNASCTTNCIAPVAAIMEEAFGVKKAMMTTIHAYTADQNIQDGPHKDLRRARAAAENIVPTSTGAALATTEIVPSLKNKFDGVAIRVPVPVGSISDFTFLVAKDVTVEQINDAMKKTSENEKYRGIVAVTEEPLVSSDIVGRSESAIVDLGLTQVVDGDMVKVFAWYDNEMGYSHRLIEEVLNIGKTL
jgi:glyceraldehyde 3-phosphate dehydrogenase